jgi:L-ascorbate metabolism protein UlaG (beta-lactamase superfamily)
MANISYVKNPDLKTIKRDWKGNPVINGRFIDPNKAFSGSFSKFLKWQFGDKPKKEEKKNDKWRLTVRHNKEFIDSNKDCIVWLGHATFFMRLKGKTFITDPIFGRISGVVKRYSEMPCEIEDLKGIDYVLLSHGHRDHCDKSTLKELYKNNKFKLLTGLGNGDKVSEWLGEVDMQQAGWWQQFNLPFEDIKITYLPAQHWSNRYNWDINKTLWGSMMIETPERNIYFGGDSGKCSYPKEIAEHFPHPDICMIGVGAYTPSFMMQDVHTSPYEAVDMFNEMGGKNFIPMHYGTFDLADEPIGEPYRLLKQMEKDGTINGNLKMLDVGEVWWL